MVVTRPSRSSMPRGLLNHPLTLYLIFLVLMLLKLMWLHHNLHAYNITMGLLDKVIAIGSLLLLSFWTWLLPRRGMIVSLAALNLLLTALIYADMVYYRYFQDFLTIPVLLQARQVDALGDSIATLIYTSDLWFFADWLVVIPFAAIVLFSRSYRSKHSSTSVTGYGSYSYNDGKARLRRRLTAGSIALVLGLGLAVGPVIFIAKHGPKACLITTGGMYPCIM